MKRQKVRKGILICSLLLFPITIWYFSPYLIIQAALEHIMNGSFVVFMTMLVGSIFLSRVFCAYLCPAGGLQECAFMVNDKPIKRDWKYNIKYVIWFLWMVGVIVSYIFGKGNYKVNFFYMTDHGISISEIYGYIIYYGILILFLIPAFVAGKRSACHFFCWMAPFMVIGSKIGRILHIPQLHIKAESSKCISCNICTKNCPMSIDVMQLVKTGKIIDAECIQCGVCVDVCPQNILHFKMKF